MFHKEETQFQDDTPLRTRTLNIFGEDSPADLDPTLGLKRFSIFRRRDSELSSANPSPQVTTKNSIDAEGNDTLGLCGSLENSHPFGQQNDDNGKIYCKWNSILIFFLQIGKGNENDEFLDTVLWLIIVWNSG